ncbi:PREDICTED: putative olfactory receptor 7A2 [Condylura cristata]|uniref:putative olfactory receptor 7A2 n=1 Tax=Condylura cristata TaxID=143302 RepID=UPI0006430F4C|nr:PREDICTED: putative olfactory receptor 7A2 [Condylura cristata]
MEVDEHGQPGSGSPGNKKGWAECLPCSVNLFSSTLHLLHNANITISNQFISGYETFIDTCFTSTTIPEMLLNILTQSKVTPYEHCITQIYFMVLFSVLDVFLLTMIAYDHFVAICHPLHYTVIMNLRLCGLLVLVSWILSALNALLESLMVLRLSFCADLEIPHFFCEVSWVIPPACSDTFVNNMVVYFAALLLGGGPLFVSSNSKLVSSIHRISSA